MNKSHATEDECLLLIKLKRQRATGAMKKILVKFGLPPHHAPDVVTILDYLTNMVYCIELMLKLLSSNWESHNVGKMYEAAFGRAHPNRLMMKEIEAALRDQKYLFEPMGGLIAQIADMESLYDELIEGIRKKHGTLRVEVSVPAPSNFFDYLRSNAGRILSDEIHVVDERPDMPLPTARSLDEYVAQKTAELNAICDFIDEFRKNGGKLEFYKGQFGAF